MFEASFNETIVNYGKLLEQKKTEGRVQLLNDNFDTGSDTGPGQYPLADKTYAELLDRLAKNHFAQVSPELRSAVLSYYNDLNAPSSPAPPEAPVPAKVEMAPFEATIRMR